MMGIRISTTDLRSNVLCSKKKGGENMGRMLKQVSTIALCMVMIVGIILSENPLYEGAFAIGAMIAGYLNGYYDA